MQVWNGTFKSVTLFNTFLKSNNLDPSIVYDKVRLIDVLRSFYPSIRTLKEILCPSFHIIEGSFFVVRSVMKKTVFGSTETDISDVMSTWLNPSHNSHQISITVPDGQATSADDQATSNDFSNSPPTFIEVTGDSPTFTRFTGSRRTSTGFAGGQHTSGEFTGGQRTATGFTGGQWISVGFNDRQFTSTKLTVCQPLSTEFTGGQPTSTGLMNV